jgi:RimJ/RimL family protein N-acetyltransferase
VNVTSLGYRTDLMIRRMEGSEITDCRDHIVVRSPAHPAYWWGNFLLLAAAPKARETAKWLARFAEVFPAAGHVALGIDTTQPDAADVSGLYEAGLRIERGTVMTAPDLREPPNRDLLADYRALAGGEDWRQSLDLRLAADEGGEFDVTRAFYEQRTADARRLAENGHGAWFGAFAGGRLVAQLGVFSDGSGIARYQNVETHPAWRRRGLAGTLVWHAGRWAFDHLGARTLVIVADPAAGAIRVYRSVGFAAAETQIGFQRPPLPGERALQISGTGDGTGRCYRSARPVTPVFVPPPTQIVPSGSRVMCTRPRRPSAAPWLATYGAAACPAASSHPASDALRLPVTGSSPTPPRAGVKARTSNASGEPAG